MTGAVVGVLGGAAAATFGVAGVAKWLGSGSTDKFLVAIGVPKAVASALGRLLPISELSVAVCLCLGLLPIETVIAALLLALGFSVTLLVAYKRHVQLSCGCFGALDSTQLTPVAIVRALVLLIVSALLVVFTAEAGLSGPSVGPVLTTTPFAAGALSAMVALAGLSLLEHVWVFRKQVQRALQVQRAVVEIVPKRQPVRLGTNGSANEAG